MTKHLTATEALKQYRKLTPRLLRFWIMRGRLKPDVKYLRTDLENLLNEAPVLIKSVLL